jgi:ABC-type phosphate/phosphonate transport system substrate-binding protein
MPIANARMYSATPAGKAAWHRVLRWTLEQAGLPWDVVDYDAPAPLSALWARDDLGLAMMCGLPFSQRQPPAQLVAAPIPSPARYEGRPVYCTDIVVRADAPFRTLEDTFGGVAGYTLADSLSGGVAFNLHLQPFRTAGRPRLYARTVGGLVNARGIIDALAAGTIDVGPLDSWYHDQLRMQDPAFAARVRTVASTQWRPIPPLVATTPLAADELARLRRALLAVSQAPVLAADRALLLLAGFAVPPDHAYAGLAHHGPLTAFEDL